MESDETIYLLATSYYRSNQLHQAYWLLSEKSRHSPQCRYLQAKCAYDLKKYAEAESALISSGFAENKHIDELQKEFGEIACFVYQLMAQICMRTERQKLAINALQRALKLNPFMWHAFTDLCLLGQDTDAAQVFQIQSTDVFNTCQGSSANANSIVLFGGSSMNDSQHQQQHQQQQHLENLLLNNFSNNSAYILNTPVDQPQQQQQLQHQNNNSSLATLQNLMTPNNNINNNINNNNNLNSSIAMLRGGAQQQQQNTNSNSSMMVLEDTPMGYATTNHNDGVQQYDSNGTPFRKQFKYLSTISPLTPSFGVMPLTSPCDVSSAALQSNISLLAYSPLPQMLVEVNQEPKIIGKKLKTHVGGLIQRQQESRSSKPAVFTQTGNITPRTPNNSVGGGGGGGNNVPPPNNPNAAVRRSSRLFSNSAYSVKENNKSPNISNNNKFVQPRSPPRKTKSSRMPKICLNNELIEEKTHHHLAEKLSEKHARNNKDKEKVETITSAANMANNRSNGTDEAKVLLNNSLNNAQTLAHQLLSMKKQSADGLMSLLRQLAEGYKLLSQFHCNAAIKQLETTIPKHHLNSSWVQSLIGVCRYEMREYEAAVTIFKQIHDAEPSRLEYMEIYSTSLWHLQKEVALSALAQDLIGQDKRSPVTWCVAGNCFSLHKEHETAIKFFKRAVQVDADFVYSYTLLGHELVLTEEFDKAMDYFRAAVVRDPRHYNAWFGIGTIYSKQEKYELAELHYVKALKINPWNSVILVHIGAMQFFMQKKDLALQTLNTAATLDPKNPLARFHRGSIYFSLGKYQEALRELEALKEIVPKESVVFYLIGKIHKTLGNMDLALMHFSWATDLDPKGANNQIKDAFDSMAHPNCCPANDNVVDVDFEPSERSDDSTQAQQDVSYDSDY